MVEARNITDSNLIFEEIIIAYLIEYIEFITKLQKSQEYNVLEI
jgi:hypothetical protein